jgi:hypothetical protein
MASLLAGFVTPTQADLVSTPEADADTAGLPLDLLETKTNSTVLFGGSAPVSFSGEARLRIQTHDYSQYPSWLSKDQTWTQANYEGNESLLRFGMIVHANRNAVLWTKIGFQHTLPGNYLNKSAGPDSIGYVRVGQPHDKSEETANIHEDMAAGLAIRTVAASFWLRMGNVLWTEASPLTIWKSQPRTFAWDYLPYEVEQPVSRYYEYNIAKGEKSGRAAWNKKAFNGIDFKSIDLPFGIQLGLLYGSFERYDNFEREYVDFSNDLAYAGETTESKGRGIGDSFRHVYHAHLGKEKAFGNLTLGFNTIGILYKPDILLVQGFRNNFGIRDVSVNDTLLNRKLNITEGRGFYKEPQVYSLDLRGPVSENWEMHADVAVSILDTLWTDYAIVREAVADTAGNPVGHYHGTQTTSKKWTDPLPGFYGKLKYTKSLPVQADIIYLPKGFYSPFSFATPVDAFFPFGANLVGPGKFVGRGEGSPYTQNMAGMLLTISPKVGYGHFRIAYGQHFQPEAANDVVFFPYRLNGQDLSSTLQSSYNRWGNNPVDHSITSGKYKRRLGDESFQTKDYQTPVGGDGGGMRSDYLSIYEGFVPYQSAAQADSNLFHPTGIVNRSDFLPTHQKWTFNFEMDGAMDIGPSVGYSHDLFLSAYGALNGVSSDFRPLAFGAKDMMLWGTYFRVEPAIALTEKFYVLALGGYENWQSNMAFMENPETGEADQVPIDYVDLAAGVGFDWDFISRVGLHGRYKWMRHQDKNYSANTWAGSLASAEIKMWF